MWKNYLNMVVRGIWKYKAFSAINILGLAIGISCSLLILLFVQYELSYDRYHENSERIYRMTIYGVLGGNEINAASSPYPMAAALPREFPEVEIAARFRPFYQDILVGLEDIKYQENAAFHADPSIFDVFSFNFLEGDPSSSLVDPYTIVITQTIADKYFPAGDALGASLTFNNDQEYLINAIIEDVPENSHFHPEIIVSFTSDEEHASTNWVSNNISTYVLLRPDTSIDEFEVKLQELVTKYVAPQIEAVLGANIDEFFASGGVFTYGIQALTDIHLRSHTQGEIETNGNISYVYTFLAVAFFILLLACINFMNLSTARSANRAREIGVRKVMGAYRSQLLLQFLAESVLLSFIALCIALPIVAVFLPSFNVITEKHMSLDVIMNPAALLSLTLFTAVVGVISGSYPAIFLSRFHPQQVLKGKFSSGAKNSWFRGGLVIIQFVISISLVAATLIVYSQLGFMRSKSLGFEDEQVIVVHRANALGEQLESFKERLSQQANILDVSSSSHIPGEGVDQNVYNIEGRPVNETHAIWAFGVGYNYIETLNFELLEGRGFSREYGDDASGYVINEAAVREFGIENPLEHMIEEPNPEGMRSGPILGVVKDFHFESMHEEIRPVLFRLREFARYLVIRAEPENMLATVAAIQSSWRETTGGQPFEYSFLDEDFEQLHQGDQKMGVVFTGFSVLAILIACLGLFGLASFTTEQRTKEIGMRKTLGASVSSIVLLMSKEFMVLVLLALLVAIPVTWIGMSQWLQLFSYRIDIPYSAFLISGTLAITVAFATVSLQSMKAALSNPVSALRDE